MNALSVADQHDDRGGLSSRWRARVMRLLGALVAYETTASNPPDGQRVIREQRLALEVALRQRGTAGVAYRDAYREAVRVARLWGVEVWR